MGSQITPCTHSVSSTGSRESAWPKWLLENDSWTGLKYASVPGVQAPSRNPQICHAALCCLVPTCPSGSSQQLLPAPLQKSRWGSATFVPARLAGSSLKEATCRFLWQMYLLAVFVIPERWELSHARNIHLTRAFLSFLYSKCGGN